MTNSPTVTAAVEIAKSIVAGTTAPYKGAAEIWRQVAETGQRDLEELRAFVGQASEWQDHPALRAEIDGDIRTAAAELVRQHEGDG